MPLWRIPSALYPAQLGLDYHRGMRLHCPPPAASSVLAAALVACLALPTLAIAQTVSGEVFVDIDGDGLRGPSEPALDGVNVTAFGPGGADSGVTTAGAFDVAAAAGCAALSIDLPTEPDPAVGLPADGRAYRVSPADFSTCPASASNPVGRLRLGAPRHLRQNLAGPGFLYISLGDSIAAGVSVCFFSDTNYVEDVAVTLGCLAGAPITVDNRAVAGWHSEDLLTPRRGANPNAQFIPNVVAARPDLVTISIGGNDFLNTEPGQAGQSRPFVPADLTRSFQELIRTRRTVQEILSTLVSELPDADIEFNTVYDNLAPTCDTTDFHAATPPVWNAMLRNVAWGQARPVVIAEVAPEFAHQDVTRTTCCGAEGQICAFDNIHPTENGAFIIEEAVMESVGGLSVPPGGISSGVAFGCQQLVATLAPTIVDVLGGTVSAPDQALALDGAGATLGFDGARLELSGFALPAGVIPTRLVVGVRYRTTGTVTDDQHLFDASVLGFAAPRLDYTGWDTVTPLVGGSGTSGNLGTPSVVNALPNVPAWRDVSASVTLNAIDDGTVTGEFSWPDPTAADVAALRVRLSTVTVGGVDPATVEWDGAWLWVYGTRPAAPEVPDEVSPPGAPTPLTLRRAGTDLVLDWQAEARSVNYRVLEGTLGDWATLAADPGAGRGGCSSSLTFTAALPAGDAFFLVAGVGAGGDQGPTGRRSDGTPRASGTATCP